MQLDAKILCLDIGSRTMDALFFVPYEELQNHASCVLPSPAYALTQRISSHTRARRDIYLFGHTMGGGFADAAREHLAAGLGLAMHPQSALSLHDNMDKVAAMGVNIVESCPPWHVPIQTCDYDPAFWRNLINMAGLPTPDLTIVAAQDHGFNPFGSNRDSRMKMWTGFINPEQVTAVKPNYGKLLYAHVPPHLTRLVNIQAQCGGMVMDSSAAALLGVLSIPSVEEQSHKQGILIANAGNSHVSAFLVYKGRVRGVYEHHTKTLTPAQLKEDFTEFRLGWLPSEKVAANGGHGCIILDLPPEAEGFPVTYITGPRREQFVSLGQLLAPHGDVMHTGCFGMLYAYLNS